MPSVLALVLVWSRFSVYWPGRGNKILLQSTAALEANVVIQHHYNWLPSPLSYFKESAAQPLVVPQRDRSCVQEPQRLGLSDVIYGFEPIPFQEHVQLMFPREQTVHIVRWI